MLCYVVLAFVIGWTGSPGENFYLTGDAAERAGNYGEAVKSFAAAAAADTSLSVYAQIRIIKCRAAAGDAPGAIVAYRQILKQYPEGPWVAMAEAHFARLLQRTNNNVEAVGLYKRLVDISPRPWWMDDYAWDAVQNLVTVPDFQKYSFSYFRGVVEHTGYVAHRLDAARRLAESPDLEDRAVAVLGMLRSGAVADAGKMLATLPTSMGPDATNSPNGTGEASGQWGRLWLTYSVRIQAASKNYDGAIATLTQLMDKYPQSFEAGETGWLLGQALENAGLAANALQAYQRLADACPKHERADDALFRIAAINLDAGRVAEAIQAVSDIARRYPASKFRAQGYYLLYRKAKAAPGTANGPDSFLTNAAQGNPGDYYAHRALDRLPTGAALENLTIDNGQSVLRPMPGLMASVTSFDDPLKNDPHIKRLRFFGMFGLEEGEWEAFDICRNLKGVEDPEPYYRAIGEAGFGHTALQIAREFGWGTVQGKSTPARLRLEFPRAYWPEVAALSKETGIDPYLILAVAKQESTFRSGIVSSAGAVGVMQLMPGTADWLGKTEPNIGPQHMGNLKSPANSLRLGAYYLAHMRDRSGGNLIDMVASYNAGPGNSDKWRKRFAGLEVDDYVESIPFSETKDYVKRVLGNYAAYHSLYPPIAVTELWEKQAAEAKAKALAPPPPPASGSQEDLSAKMKKAVQKKVREKKTQDAAAAKAKTRGTWINERHGR